MSLLLKPTLSLADVSKITCVVGTSILKVLSEYINERLYIKWVNDIYLHDKKICGILCESSIINDKVNYLIIGIGLNVNQTNFNFYAIKSGLVLTSPLFSMILNFIKSSIFS